MIHSRKIIFSIIKNKENHLVVIDLLLSFDSLENKVGKTYKTNIENVNDLDS